MKKYLFMFLLFTANTSLAQKSNNYAAALTAYRDHYTTSHDVVKGDNIKFFSFYPINSAFAVKADFTEIKDKVEVKFKTFVGWGAKYLLYCKLNFFYKGKPYQLYAYFSPEESKIEKYKNHLFIPFTDETNAVTTYGGGRYVDILTTDIKNGKVILDFNKTYNPYCAYSNGYMCPIPPKENNLGFSVEAGEKNYLKSVH